MEDILSQAKQNGATIIMLTRFCKSPGAEKSDIVLQCGSNESPLQQGSVAAKIAQFYVLDILYHEYCNKNRNHSPHGNPYDVVQQRIANHNPGIFRLKQEFKVLQTAPGALQDAH